MPLILTTSALATTTPSMTAGTFTFAADLPSDNRSRVAVLTTLGGTQTGAAIHTVDSPKMVIFKKPASFQQASGFNAVTGKYARVPKNSFRVIGKMSAKVAANQWETIPITLDIGVPAGAPTFDRVNVDSSVIAFITALYEMREELCQAVYDGLI